MQLMRENFGDFLKSKQDLMIGLKIGLMLLVSYKVLILLVNRILSIVNQEKIILFQLIWQNIYA